jgi:predicted amidophosphoribosyltransferase
VGFIRMISTRESYFPLHIEPDDPEKGKLIPIVCWNCNEENVPTNRFCSLCGMDLQRLKEDMIPAKEIGLTVQELINDKEFMLQMMEAMAKRLNEKQNLAQDG